MNNKAYISALAQKVGLNARDTQSLVNTMLTELSACFEEGDQLVVPSFGSFEVKKKLERVVTSPASGQRLLVPPRLVLTFKTSSALKQRVQKGGED